MVVVILLLYCASTEIRFDVDVRRCWRVVVKDELEIEDEEGLEWMSGERMKGGAGYGDDDDDDAQDERWRTMSTGAD